MRRFALLVAASMLVGWGVFGALGGCGGDDDDSSATPAPDGATGDEGSSGSSGGTSGGTSGSPNNDGGGGSSGGGNLPASNPGKLTCGAVECDAGFGPTSSVCCVREAGAAPVCARPQACDDGDLRVQCDEPADCAFGGDGAQCCLRGGNRDRRTECRRECGQNDVRICKTTADCGDAGACSKKKCGNYELYVCGDPEGCQ